jgi:hypothetical protein
MAALVALLSYASLIAIHLSKGFKLRDSVRMARRDMRLALAYPNRPAAVWSFVNRSKVEETAFEIAEQLTGGRVYKAFFGQRIF